jgi:hypothetical protein
VPLLLTIDSAHEEDYLNGELITVTLCPREDLSGGRVRKKRNTS